MPFLLGVLAIVAGLAIAIFGSRLAVRRAAELAAGSRIPPFVVGITLIAIGTDLPEIANSIASSVTDHGDLNAGDSIGSVVVQATLVLGLLPLMVGAFPVARRTVASIGMVTVAALGIGVVLFADGFISRIDGILLVVMWIVGSAVVWRYLPSSGEPHLPLGGGVIRRLVEVVGGLIAVGGGALLAVEGFVNVAEALAVPEYVVSFFGASIGTSLPEFVVTITALRSGDEEIGLGDILGASLIDATLSIGIGPVVAPTAITASLVLRGSLAAMAIIAMVALVLSLRERHDRLTGVVLLALYAAFYPLMLAG